MRATAISPSAPSTNASCTPSATAWRNCCNAISGSNGFQHGLGQPDSIAIDGSGNVWIVDNEDGNVTELVGAATPVVTPIAAAVKNSQLGTAP